MENSFRPLGVLIVDDQIYFCHLAREILDKCSDFAVVGESYCAEQAMGLVEELRPDVVLMDVEMDGINGLEATHIIRNRFPEVRVILTSMYDEKEYGRLAAKVGAVAFIPKRDLSAPVLTEVLNCPTYDTARV